MELEFLPKPKHIHYSGFAQTVGRGLTSSVTLCPEWLIYVHRWGMFEAAAIVQEPQQSWITFLEAVLKATKERILDSGIPELVEFAEGMFFKPILVDGSIFREQRIWD